MANDLDKPKKSAAKMQEREPPAMALEWGADNVLQINARGDFDRVLTSAPNAAMQSEWLGQMAKLGSQSRRTDESASNFALGFVDAMQPKDAAELLLTTQMAAIHQATMMLARRLNHVDNIPQQDAAERALNKLARTFAAQMDTLKRYRSKGQQTVRVERVTVESGAQAVVGNVNQGGRSGND
ncbi:hypothetical protein [Primorskyibacter flagellatus]|uniref:Uncharacterized protein n=1 Tax=Primorskyibacter flagellatus TaxID=1387277 RepID=A0A1W2B8V8_9RHOB|nr:hypothetical protein [Primorskyibacter flagellatus]SMC69220.1 hypothetical protein SAMN06295998_103487 [Primorskyibacter flagellatus]